MSRLFVIGLSHRTAPIEIREALAVSDDTVQSKLLEAARLCGEAMLLSTCTGPLATGSGGLFNTPARAQK